MAEKRWTENQKNAIYSTGGSVLVSAAAGSGKTAVLVQRVIERITNKNNPIDIDHMLIVTYTKASAAEMKERIYKKLDELIAQDPSNKSLLHQQLILGNAQISTIHSFCSDIVRSYFYDLDISPDFRLADEIEMSIIKKQAINNVLEELYKINNPDFLTLVEAYSTSKNDNNIETVILALYEFLCSHPFPLKWLDEKLSMYNINIPTEETVWGKVIIKYTESLLSFLTELINSSISIYNNSAELKSKYGDKLLLYLNNLSLYILEFKAIIKTEEWDKIKDYLSTFTNPPFPRGKKLADTRDKDLIKNKVDKIKSVIVNELPLMFLNTSEGCKEDINYLSKIVKQLITAVTMFKTELSAIKAEKNIADFNDLEYWALKLLTSEKNGVIKYTDFAKKLSEKYIEVMVDEYQDANEVQELIFKSVSNNGENLFVVGDVKQSIYGFRQANPQIFINRKSSYNLYNPGKNNYPAKIILDKNFRSRKGITDAINFVFKRLMSSELGQMNYTSEDELKCGANYSNNTFPDVSFNVLDYSNCPVDMSTLEARYIAKKIESMVGTYIITDGDTTRPATYSDFAILLRSAKNNSPTFVYELNSAGIPCRSDSSAGFITSWEISVIISLLKIIDNPIQDIPLLNVLMSPIFNFSPDDMANIRINNKQANLYLALKSYAECGNEKCINFLKVIKDFRCISATTPTDLLINYIYEKTMFTSMVAKTNNGNQKLNNLRLLQEYAKSYEETGYKGLYYFIKFISKIEEQQNDLTGSNAYSDNSDQVTVMSIHRSKGLEFPICFLANTAKRFNNDLSKEVLLHPELGLGLYRKNTEKHYKYTTMPREAVSIEIDKSGKSEELRILYVAMTRAKEKLIITSSLNKPTNAILNALNDITDTNKLSPYIVSSCNSVSDWLLRCALMHPSGNVLRQFANQPPHLFTNIACEPWDINIIETDNYIKNSTPVLNPAVKPAILPTVSFQEIKKRITSEYSYNYLNKMPAMISASELIHGENLDKYSFSSMPNFLKSSQLNGVERGTAFHAFLQYVNFKSALKDPKSEIERLVKNFFITKEQAALIDINTIVKCLNSKLMMRVINSEKVLREYQFFVYWNSVSFKDDFFDLNIDKNTVIQGAVDCIFYENDELIIIDYKSDRVKSTEQLKSTYALQLRIYKNAVEQCFNKSVKECIIYSLYLNEYISI